MNVKLFKTFLHQYPFQPATAYWRAIEIDKLLSSIEPLNGRGLDLGCGDGKLTEIILDQLPENSDRIIVGVDIDAEETSQAKLREIYNDIHTLPADNIPEEEASFDWIISNSVLEHIPEVEPVIKESSRLLKKDGLIIFTVPSTGFHQCLHGPLFSSSGKEEYLDKLDKRLAHFYYYDETEWSNLLNTYNLSVEHSLPYLSCPQVRRWENLSRFTGGLLYTVFGEKKRPIHIQRDLGLRPKDGDRRMPMFLVHIITALLLPFLKTRDTPRSATQNGCLLVIARKQ